MELVKYFIILIVIVTCHVESQTALRVTALCPYQNQPCSARSTCKRGFILRQSDEGCCCEQVCPKNQSFQGCGLPDSCVATCANLNSPPMICPAVCVSGCFCDVGLVKNAQGDCVLPEQCPATACTGTNEVYNSCGSSCGDLTCNNYKNPPICILLCKAGCFCIPNYVRSSTGVCVPSSKCPV